LTATAERPNQPDDLAVWVSGFVRQHGLQGLPLAASDELAAERAQLAAEHLETHLPARYAGAVPARREVRSWIAEVIRNAVAESQHRGKVATVRTGRSLLLLGEVGTGKTHEAYGALRVFAACGLHTQWVVTTAADLYAQMRPRHGVDAETVFERAADAPLLVVDDLAAANNSPWVEEVNQRLVDRRYLHVRPTLFTSNATQPQLREYLGDRVASRLVEMCDVVAMEGPDHRLGGRRGD
jgi:DNA replication protein DnaC